jgi:hypothetical protein
MKKSTNYSYGKIYKLVSDQTDDIYIGSTANRYLCNRLSKHTYDFRRWNGEYPNHITSFKILKYDDCKIILIEDYPCENKYQLEARERYHIENNKCVNKQVPTRTQKEYYEDTKEIILAYVKQYQEKNKETLSIQKKDYRARNREVLLEKKKEYYKNNKETINVKSKEYYENNKEKVLLQNKNYRDNHKETKAITDKEYYENNKDKISQQNKEYRKLNKELIAERDKIKTTCGICKCEVRKKELSRHQRTIKCQEALALTESTSASSC